MCKLVRDNIIYEVDSDPTVTEIKQTELTLQQNIAKQDAFVYSPKVLPKLLQVPEQNNLIQHEAEPHEVPSK